MLGEGFIGPMRGAVNAPVAGVGGLAPRYTDFLGAAGRSAENFQRRECSKADIEMDN